MTSDAFGRTLWCPTRWPSRRFAVSTMLSWSYYGLKGWVYLFGEGEGPKALYKVVFCAFVALGATVELDAALDFSDAMTFVLCVPCWGWCCWHRWCRSSWGG